MAMGTRRKREKQHDLWIAASDVVETPGNAFYDRLNQILDGHKFDSKVEQLCRKFYKKSPYGRPSLSPGVYFRCLLIGYFVRTLCARVAERERGWQLRAISPRLGELFTFARTGLRACAR